MRKILSKKDKGNKNIDWLFAGKPTDESRQAAKKIEILIDMLEDIEALKTYDRDLENAIKKLQKAGNNVRKKITAAFELGILKRRHERTDVEEYEKKFKEYENVIDRKYWNGRTLSSIEMILTFGAAHSIEEAVKIYEESV